MEEAPSRGGEVEYSAPVKAQAGRRLCLGSSNALVGSGFGAPAGRKGATAVHEHDTSYHRWYDNRAGSGLLGFDKGSFALCGLPASRYTITKVYLPPNDCTSLPVSVRLR